MCLTEGRERIVILNAAKMNLNDKKCTSDTSVNEIECLKIKNNQGNDSAQIIS